MYWVYLLRCADDSLYCGITNDVPARLAAHSAGRGARYTRGRGPLELVLKRRCADKGTALRLEYAIKQLDRPAKLALTPSRLTKMARAIAATYRAV
ncbi:GIY-YIG nuclease family protein [soil metagenome]